MCLLQEATKILEKKVNAQETLKKKVLPTNKKTNL